MAANTRSKHCSKWSLSLYFTTLVVNVYIYLYLYYIRSSGGMTSSVDIPCANPFDTTTLVPVLKYTTAASGSTYNFNATIIRHKLVTINNDTFVSSRKGQATSSPEGRNESFIKVISSNSPPLIHPQDMNMSLIMKVRNGDNSSLSSSNGTNMSLFTTVIKRKDMEIHLTLTDAFHEAMTRQRVPYFMYGGTLIGSWRHHGFIPWDDDVDVAVPSDERHQVFCALNDLKPQFLLFNSSGARWKFYSNRSRPIEQRPFRWPYIDISFYLSNETRVWDVNTGPNSKYSYPVHIVFPLQPRPFMNRLLPAPFNTEEVLKASYNIKMCQIGPYDHVKEKYKTLNGLVTNVPCKELENMFPFVQRVRLKTRHGCNETLVNNGSTAISWFYRDYGSC